MIIVDAAMRQREKEGRPVIAALYGAGFIGRGLVNQFFNYAPGVRLGVIVNRTPQKAVEALRKANVPADRIAMAETAQDVDAAIRAGKCAVASSLEAGVGSELVEVVVEATGHVDYGARVLLAAIENGKHIVNLNAELDATVGPILKVRADRRGVVLSGGDGDQPGVTMNLVRFVRAIGMRPLLCGNIKGLLDHYRTPATQAAFAAKWNQTPEMVTSFADGTKTAFEQTVIANACGMSVAQRGMIGLEHHGHVDELTGAYDVDMMREKGGIVDFVLGAKPGPGVFVFAEAGDADQQVYLNYVKMGDGPLYSFYIPYHLVIFEVPIAVARAALFRDAVIEPAGPQMVDAVAIAKRDLKAGEMLDGIGGFCAYGLAETAEIAAAERLVPMGLLEGYTLERDVPKDAPITFDAVQARTPTLLDTLRAEQDAHFTAAKAVAAE